MLKLLSKILVLLQIAIILLNMVASTIYAAVEVKIDKAYIEKIGEAKYHLKYYREDGNEYRYITCDIVGFYDKSGNFNPAYCMNRDLKGAGEESYYVKAESLLKNNKVWRVIKNGYPYKSAKQLGLESKNDAFVVTKHAVYCILGEAKLEYYKAEKDDPEAVAMLKVLKQLVEIGEKGTEKQDTNPLSLKKVGELKEENDFYSQEYKLESTSDFNNYEVSKIEGMPKGAYISNITGNKGTSFKANQNFKIIIPKSELTKDIQIKLTAKAECKSYIILEGKTTVTKTQNYVVTAGEFATATTDASLDIKPNNASIIINKISKDDLKLPIQNVKFELYKENKLVDTKQTDQNGKIKFENLYPGKYTIKEVETDEKYILENIEHEVEVEYNGSKEITIENARKTGKIKVIKVDKDNAETKLEGVKFDLYSEEENKTIGTYATDENGEINIDNLPTGEYKIIEKETNKWYNLADEIKLKVNYNETTETTIVNELKKGQVKVIKVDKDDNEIKLKCVKFEVQDKDGNVLETLVTDEKGEAITSKYALKDYENLYLKEIETNENYVLNEKISKIKLEENEIKDVKVENEKIKGKIKMVKTSKDYNKITGLKAGSPLKGVKFEIYNSEGDLVDKITTDKNGIAITSYLEKGDYTIKEIETNKYYYLNTDSIKASIEKDKEIVTINVTNESQNPDIDVEKSGPNTVEVGKKIEYDISVRNTGNTKLDNFTLTDILPSDYIDVTNFKTGTYNQDLSYDLYYKSNISGNYILFMEDLKTKENYEINFAEELADNEFLTEIKLDFGTVDIGFCSNENPHITGIVRKNIKSETTFTNTATVSGDFEGKKVKDKSKWKTKTYKYLPKTGF